MIRTPFGFSSTAAEVAAGADLHGRRALVTGASSGIGIETARALTAAGAEVTLAVRDVVAGERVATAIGAGTAPAPRVVALDLADPSSVAALVAGWDGPLHVLVNNAGIMACPEQRTSQGWELQFATNHLGHFALATGLHAALAADGDARIVSVSSKAHQRSPVVLDDLHYVFRSYEPWAAYGQSKTANVLFAVEVTRRWARDGITANAAMPGAVTTNLGRHLDGPVTLPDSIRKNPEQGAATSVLLAVSPLLQGIGGRYFSDVQQDPVVTRPTDDLSGVAAYAVDPANAERLWETSEQLLARVR